MISIEHSDNLVTATVFGEFTVGDYKDFEQQVLFKIGFAGKVNVLLDLRDMVSYTLDLAWEEIRFGRSHAADFGKIAVVSDDQWVIWSAWLSRLFVDAEIRVFDDEGMAREWLAQD